MTNMDFLPPKGDPSLPTCNFLKVFSLTRLKKHFHNLLSTRDRETHQHLFQERIRKSWNTRKCNQHKSNTKQKMLKSIKTTKNVPTQVFPFQF